MEKLTALFLLLSKPLGRIDITDGVGNRLWYISCELRSAVIDA